jgi:hypothetical protein
LPALARDACALEVLVSPSRRWLIVPLLALLGLLFWQRPWDDGASDTATSGIEGPDGDVLVGERGAAGEVVAGPVLEGVGRVPSDRSGATEAGDANSTDAALDESKVVRFTGRVVDSRRRPVAGAEVAAFGRIQTRARTDADGKFSLQAARPAGDGPERVSLVARRGSDEVGTLVEVTWLAGTASRDVGTIVLQGGHSLDVEVRSEGRPAAEAVVLIQGWSQRTAGYLLARARTDGAGRARLPPLPEGAHRIVAHAQGRGRAVQHVGLPREQSGALVLELPSARSVALTLVFEGDEAPVAGAAVELWDLVRGPGWGTTSEPYQPARAPLTSDARGLVQLEGLAPDDTFEVRVSGPGVAAIATGGFTQGPQPRVAAAVTEARIAVPRPRRLRWPLTAEHGPVPAEGTVARLRQDPGGVSTSLPPGARVEGGELVADGVGPGHVHAFAMTDDGRVARLFAKDKELVGNPTSFRRARRIEVEVREEGGVAPQGLAVVARSQGGSPIGPAVPLDAEGRAVLDGLHGGLVEVHLTPLGDDWGQQAIGTVDLDAGDGRVTAVVPRARRGLVRVRIDGVAGLPESYHLSAGVSKTTDLVEDPERGEIAFTWRPRQGAAEGTAQFLASGYLRRGRAATLGEQSPWDTLPLAQPEPDLIEVDLERGGALLVRVRPPKDGRARVLLQRWDEARAGWAPHEVVGRMTAIAGQLLERERIAPLRPGRYRALDADTRVASEAVDVALGGREADVVLDLSRVGFVRGRVEVPAGGTIQQVQVRLEGLDDPPAPPPAGLSNVSPRDGSFSLRVPGDRPVTLVATHPLLVPAPDGGRVQVREPREGVVLRLVEGALARVALDLPAGAARPVADEFEGPRVLLFREGAEEPASIERPARLADGVLTVGGYAPGTYRVWLDVAPFAPLDLGRHTLGDGPTDLGRASLSTGAAVTIRLLVPDRQAPPRLVVNVQCLATPSYGRFLNSKGEALVRLSGLLPGKHRLVVGSLMGALRGKGLDEEIELPENGTLERTIDLR